ncbi:uncharacterized protein LOC104902598 isoform X2 [Beta vulgaris subsp. vulgaris]|uniref:uncharacterized protein LOC104902598 isoform X2 n=1 Tax=Beta vulgaris subsp. vulgaris TaxID=3555 RepID=UPI002036C506|nr:uncharacterized protein LOC104902598 isoform X2 [Beta vulgaris subsp. vulgaris]
MTTSKLLFSSNNHRFRILLRPLLELRKSHVAEDAWLQRRLLCTAAAREIPIVENTISKRSLSKLRRKAMIEDYVKKYRSMNAGKFPLAKNVQKHVGGSYYTVKTILQELHHNPSSSALATAANSSIWQTAQGNGISDAGVTTACQVSDDSIAVVEEYGTAAGCDLSCEEVVDENICQKMVDMSETNNYLEETAKYPSSSEKKADLDFVGEHDKTFAGKEMGEDSRIMESQEMLDMSSTVENPSSNQVVTMDDLRLPAKPGHPSIVTDTSNRSEYVEVDEASAKAFESYEVARESTLQKTEDKKLQKSSLWGNLKGFANNIINFWRTT